MSMFLFRGEYEYSVDDRGRMLVPPSYKAALTDAVVMGRGKRGQLWVYPKPAFEKVLEELEKTPFEDQDDDYDDAMRFLLAGQEIEFDKQGRLSIPPFLREQTGIKNIAIVAGNGNCVELWNPDRYHETYAHWQNSGPKQGTGRLALKRAGFKF